MEVLKTAGKISSQEIPVNLSGRRPGDPAVVLASAEKAGQLLDWHPQFSDLETLLKTMLSAYRSFKQK